jgi:tetratricopeptide (TPR) repeat protein
MAVPSVWCARTQDGAAEFDKRFAFVEADTKSGWITSRMEEGPQIVFEKSKTKDWGAVIKEPGSATCTPATWKTRVYEALAEAYLATGNKKAAIEELLRYEKIGGRDPESLKLLSKTLEEAGRTAEAADALNRLNFIYPIDTAAHRSLGGLWLTQGNVKGAIREFAAVLAKNPQDLAQAHFDLARAYHADKQDEQAKEELLAALEAAPGFRPAQKLLLELSTTAKN